ncbi:MAG: hypothetical protein EI684_03695 [Candidatus Viridilinea halotolerans]|uniref:Uncharacterized protein n=1 Tax=Candidatus Viridilinea halotolerans TaxID=2491704 RepID=A0A426U7I0_9CHLR|nr:MAG: hypothetical protein EI684_03695 [Candidatus Viridilinea halotolerans]
MQNIPIARTSLTEAEINSVLDPLRSAQMERAGAILAERRRLAARYDADLAWLRTPATHAVHMLSFYQQKYQVQPQAFPNAWAANECSISLPLFHGLLPEEQEYVIEAVRR